MGSKFGKSVSRKIYLQVEITLQQLSRCENNCVGGQVRFRIQIAIRSLISRVLKIVQINEVNCANKCALKIAKDANKSANKHKVS